MGLRRASPSPPRRVPTRGAVGLTTQPSFLRSSEWPTVYRARTLDSGLRRNDDRVILQCLHTVLRYWYTFGDTQRRSGEGRNSEVTEGSVGSRRHLRRSHRRHHLSGEQFHLRSRSSFDGQSASSVPSILCSSDRRQRPGTCGGRPSLRGGRGTSSRGWDAIGARVR